MKIVSAYFDDGAFLIVTTGARFEYAAGELKIYQGLGGDLNRRLVATLTIEDVGRFEKVEANDDHVLLWSENLNIGIYGDSTCILAPKVKLGISFIGNFKPDYEGRYKGELLLIDDLGGMEIYPQRYEAGYELKRIELGKKDWVAEYLLNANERVMIAAFPGRAFDWEKSFNSQIRIMQTVLGRGPYNPDGQTLPDYVFREWSRYIDIVIIWHHIYEGAHWTAPYVIDNEPELRRVMKICKEVGIKVGVYTSLFYHYRKYKDIESYYEQIKALHDEYGIDGVYIDGLRFDVKKEQSDDKITNWEMIRRLRQLFGASGVIIFHDTHAGTPVSTVPNIDTYCDATLAAEGYYFKSFDEPYMKYQLRKYGISNTIAIIAPGKNLVGFDKKWLVDEMLKINGRWFWWGEGVRTGRPPPNFWKTKPGPEFQYYMTQLEKLEKSYRDRKKTLHRK